MFGNYTLSDSLVISSECSKEKEVLFKLPGDLEKGGWTNSKAGICRHGKEYEMTVEMLKSKIHRAVVKQADLEYVGSITVDEDLLNAAGRDC